MSATLRPWQVATGAALALVVGACSDSSPDARNERPAPRGVLLISIDSLRADHLSCFGYRSATRPDVLTSPVIDAELAAQGVVFDQAVSTTSWTVPAHKSLLTGLPDELHGGTTLSPLPASRHLLAEAFHNAGWRTAGFFSGPNLNPWYGFGRGFEEYHDCSNAPIAPDDEVFEVGSSDELQHMAELQRLSHQGITSPKLVDAFDRWFSQIGPDEPFFAFVHMWDVHFDYAAPPEDDVFFPGYDGTLDGSNYIRLEKAKERDPRDVQRLISLYDAEIRFTDRHVGLLLENLRAEGRLDDTLVVLVSDHGEEFFEHGHFGHNRTLFEEVVHVPVILRYPRGLPQGTRVEDLVSLTNVAPTILELCGLPRPSEACAMWGRSLLPALDGQLTPREAPLDLRLMREDDPLRGVRGADFKLVKAASAAAPELYDLRSDAGELHPEVPAADDPRLDRAGAVWRRLFQCATELGAGDEGTDGGMPAALLNQLRGLGYVGEDRPEEPPKDAGGH